MSAHLAAPATHLAAAASPAAPRRARLACRAQQQQHPLPQPPAAADRRTVLLSAAAAALAGVAGVAPPPAARAAADVPPPPEGFSWFFGLATPPTSYGGYGGNAKEDAKYVFQYPSAWKPAKPNKVEKGTQGIDCRVTNPAARGQQVFVITFGRAGEDNKSFKLTDIDQTFAGFAGADPDMQDAISNSTDRKTSTRDVGGQTYYDIELEGPDVKYLSSITVSQGKVYALFVKSPARLFGRDEAALRNVVATFRTV